MLTPWIPPVLPDYADVHAALKHRTSVGRSSAENFLSEGNSTDSLEILCRSSESLGMDTIIHWGKEDILTYREELPMPRPQSSLPNIGHRSQDSPHKECMSKGTSSSRLLD